MSWSVERLAVPLAAALLLAGCYEHHLCGSPESCNYEDDDCDDLIDEDFVDESGIYFTVEHCGACGVSCAEVFPTAAETACDVDGSGTAACRIVSCAPGFHLAGDGACVPDVPVICLPCNDDGDCALRRPGTVCIDTSAGGRCAPPCDTTSEEMPCPPGAACGVDGLCTPLGGDCTCNAATLGLEIACLVDRGDGHQCGGVQVCGEEGFGPCEPALEETCNDQDDDCDGAVDEDFRDEAGRYVARLHCGGCAIPCVEPGPNMEAECLPDGAGVRCAIACLEGFVDVDGILANGCECERWDGMGPPPVIGGDADCDGVPDDTDDFIYVTTTGSDTNPGTLARPKRTIQNAMLAGRSEAKDVLVARGIYDGPFDVVGGVDVFGGYRPDFRDRDLELYPVLIERRDLPPGSPVLTCHGVTAATRVEGFTLGGTDATAPGEGSTTLYVDRCGSAVRFAALTVLAGRGSDGARGDDSSDNLRDWGLGSLDELKGVDGTGGQDAAASGCSRRSGGRGGGKVCLSSNVGGGAGGDAACPGDICSNGSPCANGGCTDFTVGGVCDFATVTRLAVSNPPPGAGRGSAGGAAGELTYNAPTNRGVCNFCDDNPTLPRNGGIGGDGASGDDGGGGLGCGLAPVADATTGRISASGGTDGSAGGHGAGGGGGSAGSGYEVIRGTMGVCEDRSGGAGGGGGSGGCGAPGADGGGGGGVSAGVLIRLPTASRAGPTLEGVRIVSGSGGAGGDGGIGASGGSPGTGALGGNSRFWCSRNGGRGGDGGRGGAAGAGGGGCGGGSHGIVLWGGTSLDAYRTSLSAGTTIELTGVPGRGGRGGFSPGAAGTDGVGGAVDPIFLLP